ncbi:MAG: hypothetical protein ACHREM_31175 [Polyangiales bacterium]
MPYRTLTLPICFALLSTVACSGKLDETPSDAAVSEADVDAVVIVNPTPGPGSCGNGLGDGNIPAASRAVAGSCAPSSLPSVDQLFDPDSGLNYTPPPGGCHGDAECPIWSGWTSRCAGATATTGGTCTFDACHTDSDCTGGAVCGCQGSVRGWAGSSAGNACIPADCRTDADCGFAGHCSASAGGGGPFYGIGGYYCHTAQDECTKDADCCNATPGAYCAYDPTKKHWACSSVRAAG